MDEYESLVIEVTGINNNTSKDTLENYFSSSKRGGDIAKIEYIKGSGNASITFADAEGRKTRLSLCVVAGFQYILQYYRAALKSISEILMLIN
jgi:hypothetical protein